MGRSGTLDRGAVSALQRLAGNRGVSSLMRRPPVRPVQRVPDPGTTTVDVSGTREAAATARDLAAAGEADVAQAEQHKAQQQAAASTAAADGTGGQGGGPGPGDHPGRQGGGGPSGPGGGSADGRGPAQPATTATSSQAGTPGQAAGRTEGESAGQTAPADVRAGVGAADSRAAAGAGPADVRAPAGGAGPAATRAGAGGPPGPGGAGPVEARGTGPQAGQAGGGVQGPAEGQPAGPSGAAELGTEDLALVDEELAEHERWRGATNRVGEAFSGERADFIAEAAGGGALAGFAQGAAMGFALGVGSRMAAKFVPIPGVGAAIGGAVAAYGLATRDWGETRATIGKFGEGADDYERLANSIAAVSEVIDVITNVLNVLSGIIGIIAAAMWVITIATVGVASPLAATLSAIALGIQAATMVVDAINNLVLQPCVLAFRALHTFTSEADPREVEHEGADLSTSAGKMAGMLGGFAGGALANVGAKPQGAGKKSGASEPPGSHPPEPHPPATEAPAVEGRPTETSPWGRLKSAVAEQRALPPHLQDSHKAMADVWGPRIAEWIMPGTGKGEEPLPHDTPGPLPDGPLPDGPLPDGPLPDGPLPHEPVPGGSREAPRGGRRGGGGRTVGPATAAHPAVGPLARNGKQFKTSRLSEANAVFQGAIRANPNYEFGVWYNPTTRQWAVTKGGTGSVDPPARGGPWEGVAHHHPGRADASAPAGTFDAPVVPGSKSARGDVMPSTSDVRTMLYDVITTRGARRERIAIASGEYTVTFAFDPSTGQLHITGPYGPGGRSQTHTITSMKELTAFQRQWAPGSGDRAIPSDAKLWADAMAAAAGGTTPSGSRPSPTRTAPSGGAGSGALSGLPGAAGAAAARAMSPHEQREAAFAAQFTDDNQLPAGAGTVVERVNPRYQDPPGTPADIAALKGEIVNILGERAQAELAQQRMARQQAAHEANRAPFDAAVKDATGGTSAVDAHQQAIAHKNEANARKKAEQENASSTVGTYANRAAGIVALTGPLAAFERFSHYASMIPGPPGRAMTKLHTDSTRLLATFAGMDTKMGQVGKEQPAKQAQIAGEKDRITATDAKSKQSATDVKTAQEGAGKLKDANESALKDAVTAGQTAGQEKQELTDAAQVKQEKAQTLAAKMDAWAQEHQAARRTAIAQTMEKLRQKGYDVSETSQP
ncbi:MULTISPECIES: hypothetical protein [unclassified Saccharothrix]|uniref:hypothetical protein n=1 Tax=unclassified Saccharothrix TaxID=2593673 RepID=UPI00307ECAC3